MELPKHNHSLSPTPPTSAEPVRGAEGSWRGMILSTAIFAGVSAIILFAYGIFGFGFPQDYIPRGSLLITALGIQAVFAGITSFLALHAGTIRRKILESLDWKQPTWGENTENPYQIEVDQAKIIHFFVLGMIPNIIMVLFTLRTLYINWNAPADKVLLIPSGQSILVGLLCMVGCIFWLMLARSYDTIAEEDPQKEALPEAKPLAEMSWESCWWMGLCTAALFLKLIFPSIELFLAYAILLWVLAVSVEQFCRFILGWFQAKTQKNQFTSPITVFLRYMVFVQGNPIHSLFYTLEQKWGVSFRSSWAIRFVARATLPAILLALLLSWLLSSLYVVRINELGIRRDFGKLHSEILSPGLHLKLPFPFGSITTYPVKEIQIMPIGFEQPKSQRISYLWTHKEAKEFELALGNGNEAIAIHAMVFYKIREDKEGFLQYALQFQNPTDTINNFAHHCLTELTRNSTLDTLLATKRDVFAAELLSRLQNYINENQIGVEIIDVAMVSLHPPADVADAYLDVISADTDAKRVVTQARGTANAAVFHAIRDYNRMVTDAETMKYSRIARAHAEEDDYIAAAEAYRLNPDCYRMVYWLDSLQDILRGKNLILVDRSLNIFYDMKGTESSENQLMAE
ncbi:MAG: protease modulator HflK [Planctomycetia bacterium]|nr:protease modulator HflK [Planctomycetia bacterium]